MNLLILILFNTNKIELNSYRKLLLLGVFFLLGILSRKHKCSNKCFCRKEPSGLTNVQLEFTLNVLWGFYDVYWLFSLPLLRVGPLFYFILFYFIQH